MSQIDGEVWFVQDGATKFGPMTQRELLQLDGRGAFGEGAKIWSEKRQLGEYVQLKELASAVRENFEATSDAAERARRLERRLETAPTPMEHLACGFFRAMGAAPVWLVVGAVAYFSFEGLWAYRIHRVMEEVRRNVDSASVQPALNAEDTRDVNQMIRDYDARNRQRQGR